MAKHEAAKQGKAQQPGSTRNNFTKAGTLLSCGIAVAAIAWLQFSSDSFFIGSGPHQHRGTDKPHNRIVSEDDRLILSVAGVLDTRKVPAISIDRYTKEGNDGLLQWYVQTVPRLTEVERRELETDAGMVLGEYFPNNAYLTLCSAAQAARFSKARHVVWVGQRPNLHKIDPVLSNKGIQKLQQNGTLTWMKLDLFLFPNASAQAEDLQQYSQVLQQSKDQMSTVLEVRPIASSKIILEMPLRDARKTISWLSKQPETLWVGKREVYSTRNRDSNKILTLGGSEQAKYRTNDLLNKNDLNGRGQMIAVSDTGLDFDHCMLWQESFPFPCYDGFDLELFNPRCPASGYAAMLGNPDFYQFVTTMLNTEVDVPLLAGAAGASSARPPLDLQFPIREERIAEGYRFALGGDPDIDILLRYWSQVRPQLLPILTDSSMCDGCGGQLEFVNGTSVFVPRTPYRFLKADSTNAVAKERIEGWMELQNVMLEKCFCFFTEPSLATEDPIEDWKGVIPPVRALQDLASTPTSAITRKAAGLTALPYEVLGQICNISQMRGNYVYEEGPQEGQRLTEEAKRQRDESGVLTNMCRDVTFEWSEASGNITYNLCDLEWDARGIETALAKCFDLVYLVPPRNVPVAEETAEDRRLQYTYSSTLAWWDEYSRIPPFNSVDRSRRVVNAYYGQEGCAPCGMCERLRIDSRDYAGMMTTAPMPARVDRSQMLAVYLRPDEEDWRLDSFEARSVDFMLKITVTAVIELRPGETTIQAIDNAGVCLLTNQAYEDARAGEIKYSDYWEQNCLNPMAVSDQENLWSKTAEAGLLRSVEFEFEETVDPLERSADGWQVVVLNNETRSMSFSVVMQLYTKGVDCSDKLDGEAQLSESTHSIGFGGNTHVSSLADDDICELEGLTYCDATTTSGRQLDECFVCGGSCFMPECNPRLCLEHNPTMARVRFFGEFPTGEVRKEFLFGELSAPFTACPSPTSDEVRCDGVDCNEFGECRGRRETYKVDTHFVTVRAGVPYIFVEGDLNLEYTTQEQLYAVSARVLERPDRLLRQKIALDGKGAGGATLHLRPEALYYPAERILDINGTNFTFATIAPEEDHFEASGNVSDFRKLFSGLRVTVPASAGTTRKTRQFLLRIQIRAVAEDGSHYRAGSGYPAGTLECGFAGVCECMPGFTGAACDMIARPTDIWITVEPRARGHRVLPAPKATAGRRPTLARDGHGTHVVTSIVGKTDDSESAIPGTSQMEQYDALAHGAFLAFIDIGKSGGAYLTPPESLGEGLMGTVYREAGARVMLHPWNCEDVAWWKKQDEPFQPEQAVAGNKALHYLPSICNRYTTGTWEVDDFIASHPDLTVVFPAGNNGKAGERTVSAPGTCKNCITVGMSQSWPEHLAEDANFSLTQCRPEDCPQDVDKTETCATLGKTSPEQLPTCCRNKYKEGAYSPDYVDVPSSRGPTITTQATYSESEGDIYASLDQIVMRRVKPDVVAPGLNVVSGRSDGNPSSGGTYGCRCCISPEGATDRSALMTMSGTSQAAAKVTAAAAIVRQYFAEGYYPLGVFELAPSHEASSALVKAVLVASADVMPRAVREGGQVEDLSWRVGPTDAAGFGRVNINNVLRMGVGLDRSPPPTMPPAERCTCTGNNTLFWNLYPEWNRTRGFPVDYGTECSAWHAMPGGAKCDEMFPDNLDQRPSPYNSETYDLSCCMQWCFVEPTCATAIPWNAVPGLYYSFSTCPERREIILNPETCEFGPRNIATLAKDHKIDRVLPDVEPPAFVPVSEPLSGAITQGEAVGYETYVMEATERHPLVVALVYTDPPNALGSANVLVNDLDLEVTITPVQLAPGQSLRNSSKQLDSSRTVLYRGNEVAEGDRYNNVERVRVFKIDSPSRVFAKVTAVRVVANAEPGGGPGLCQSFALVITGNLEEDAVSDGPEVITEPSPMTPGICGREPAEIIEVKETIQAWLVAVLVSCSLLGCIICICIAYRYVSQTARSKSLKAEDSSAPPNVGYVSRVEKVEKEYGEARGGGPDFIILAEAASDVDNYYCGLPIYITEGNGESEQSTITAYDGRSRRAEAEFDMGPSAGSKYAISHPGKGPMGYKVGEAGYIPVNDLPDAAPGQPKIYQKQQTTLARARHKFGRFAENQLAAMGIGRPKREWNKKEEVQAVHAGIQIGKPVTSEDLYQFAMQSQTDVALRQAESTKYQDTPLQAQLKNQYYDQVERAKLQQAGKNVNKEGLKGRNMMRKLTGTATNDAPRLRTMGGARQQSARGYLKAVDQPAIISSTAGGVSLQTWDVETASPPGPGHNSHNGHGNGHGNGAESPDRPRPEEPRSGTKEDFEMVSATVLVGKSKRSPNGQSNGNGHGNGNGNAPRTPRTPRNGEETGAGVALRTPRTQTSLNASTNGGQKLTPAQKAALIDQAFGPKTSKGHGPTP